MRIKNLRSKLIITFILMLFAALIYFSGIQCVFIRLFNTQCPGCGMTRALICALRLDFKAAFSYHAMFWSVPLLYIAFLFDGKLFSQKYLNIMFYVLIGGGFILNWFL